jgi:two-component system capsular synthesis response regulator RcsB
METTKARLLHLDDDTVQTRLFEMLLRDEPDLEHVGALNESATLMTTIESRRPDVLLMDLRMHADDPLTTISRVRERFPEIAIVLFTGDDDPQVLAAARAAGVTHHVTKGCEVAVLLATIRKAISTPGTSARPAARRDDTAGSALF